MGTRNKSGLDAFNRDMEKVNGILRKWGVQGMFLFSCSKFNALSAEIVGMEGPEQAREFMKLWDGILQEHVSPDNLDTPLIDLIGMISELSDIADDNLEEKGIGITPDDGEDDGDGKPLTSMTSEEQAVIAYKFFLKGKIEGMSQIMVDTFIQVKREYPDTIPTEKQLIDAINKYTA